MKDDLLQRVQSGLKARKGQWRQIADDLAPEVSYSFIAKVGRGKYDSDPSHRRLSLVLNYLVAHPATKERAAA